ncbi:MAG: adenylate/guanylate cyclase domain-containing protein [Anaerolineae bacterium]
MWKLSTKSKFTLIMIVVALLAILTVGSVAWSQARRSMLDAQFANLTSNRTNKARQIENYFETMNNQLIVLSEDLTIVSAMVQFNRGFKALEETEVPVEYNETLERYYSTEFLPRLEENLTSGVPEYNVFRPQSQPSRYLQYHYLTNNGNAVGFKHFLDDAEDGSEYSQYHKKYHDNLRQFLLKFSYYDLFLIDFDTGDIVYSVFKEVDYGTNLLTGPYRNSALSEVVQKVMKDPIRQKVQIVDFEPYAPSYNAPAAFIAAPIFNGEHVVGILALQVPINEIDAIMTGERQWAEEGLGESGETYLVGSDKLMRSNSRFMVQDKPDFLQTMRSAGTQEGVVRLMDQLETTLLLLKIDTEGSQAALGGEADTRVIADYRGVDVLSAFSPVDIDGLDWVILSEIDLGEVLAPVDLLLRNTLIATAIFIPLIALGSIWLAQNLLRPLQDLLENAKKILHADQVPLTEDVDINVEPATPATFDSDAPGEFGQLGGTINQIIEQVEEKSKDADHKHGEYVNMLVRTMPESVAERYRNGEEQILDQAKQAVAIFLVVRGFRPIFDEDNYKNAFALHNAFDSQINELAATHGIDLFDNIGMEYVGICGLTTPYLNFIDRTLKFAQAFTELVGQFNLKYGTQLNYQIGLDIGPMLGTLIVSHKTNYEILGEAIYISQEVGYAAEPGRIAISEALQRQLAKEYQLEDHGVKIRVDGTDMPIWDMPVPIARALNHGSVGV